MEQHSSSIARPDARDAKTQLLPSEVLSRAADLIEPEGKWTQKHWARVGTSPTSFADDEATCWCLRGAIARLSNYPVGMTAEGYVGRVIGSAILARWNDAPNRTQAEVLAALRKASELAKADGQ